ncbi:MAG: ChbG/HpnK family deacetylase [Calditrichae bacterium]|nr:ChbG/HpnK family deacetylase [Calditrichota bacterium]MCB9058493.1 ChbG/HpnK family deacetylase [Calditrichia bacterium]
MIKRIIVLIIFLTNLTFSQNHFPEPQNKYLLLRLDDFGMCHSVNMAIQKAMESGLVFSTSVMFACPWYQEAVTILKENPQISVGVHLTLNAEWKNYRWGPIIGPEAASTLVDSNGFFFPSRSKLFGNNPDLTQIEAELRAQVERAVNSGVKIDYLDYHMGAAVQTEQTREIVEKLAKEFNLGIAQYYGEDYSNATYYAPLGSKADSVAKRASELEAGKINLQVVHVGLDDAELKAMKDLNPWGPADMSTQRQGELDAILSKQFRNALKQNNINLITYRTLNDNIGVDNMERPGNFK